MEPLEKLVKSVLDEDRIRNPGLASEWLRLTDAKERMEIYKEDIPYGTWRTT